MSSYELILLRHGESQWNAKNLFTGWVDVALSAKGEDEARRGGTLLAAFEGAVNEEAWHRVRGQRVGGFCQTSI